MKEGENFVHLIWIYHLIVVVVALTKRKNPMLPSASITDVYKLGIPGIPKMLTFGCVSAYQFGRTKLT